MKDKKYYPKKYYKEKIKLDKLYEDALIELFKNENYVKEVIEYMENWRKFEIKTAEIRDLVDIYHRLRIKSYER